MLLFDQIWLISQEILTINDPYNYDNKNNIAKDVNGTDNNYIKHGCFLISLEIFWTLLKFGPKNSGQLNFRTQFCPKIKTSEIFCETY